MEERRRDYPPNDELNGEKYYSHEGVETETPFDLLVKKEEGTPDGDEDLNLSEDATAFWEFLIPLEPWLPSISSRAFLAAKILEVELPWNSCADPWGAGDPANARKELTRLQLLDRDCLRHGDGILERGNRVGEFLMRLAARGATATKFLHRLVMFAHLLSRGDVLLHADGSELAGLMGRHRRGLLVPLRSSCENLLGVRGLNGLSDTIRQQIRARRQGNTSRAGGKWVAESPDKWSS